MIKKDVLTCVYSEMKNFSLFLHKVFEILVCGWLD